MSFTRSRKTTCLLSFLIFFCILLSYTDLITGRSALYTFILPLGGVFIVAALIVVAVKTTIVTWITVLVILAFTGNRRRVLVVEGRKITADVAMHLVKVVIKERGFVAIACATVVSSVAMVLVKES